MVFNYDYINRKYCNGNLTAADYQALEAWAEKIRPSGSNGGAIGGTFTWHITPTGIGTFISVSCSLVAHNLHGERLYNERSRPIVVETYFNFDHEF